MIFWLMKHSQTIKDEQTLLYKVEQARHLSTSHVHFKFKYKMTIILSFDDDIKKKKKKR